MFCSFPFHISRTKISVNYTGKLYGSLKHDENHKSFLLNVLLYNMMPAPYTYWYLNCRAVLVPSMLSVEPALNPMIYLLFDGDHKTVVLDQKEFCIHFIKILETNLIALLLHGTLVW